MSTKPIMIKSGTESSASKSKIKWNQNSKAFKFDFRRYTSCKNNTASKIEIHVHKILLSLFQFWVDVFCFILFGGCSRCHILQFTQTHKICNHQAKHIITGHYSHSIKLAQWNVQCTHLYSQNPLQVPLMWDLTAPLTNPWCSRHGRPARRAHRLGKLNSSNTTLSQGYHSFSKKLTQWDVQRTHLYRQDPPQIPLIWGITIWYPKNDTT